MKKLLWCAAFCFTSVMVQAQTTVELNPEKDNSIYEESENSNGEGKLFAGRTCDENNRRALIEFDITSMVPPGATITDVTLTLNVDNFSEDGLDADFSLHRVVTEWGEGTSSGGGEGAAAVAPDATWTYAMFETEDWIDVGGDFVETASATTMLPTATGDFTWTSAGMVSNVQNWLDYPTSNHGWILIGDELATCTGRRFGSSEEGVAPILSITYVCDPIDPLAVCQSLTVYLDDAGVATIADSDLDGGSVVSCDDEISFSASHTEFSCEDIAEVDPVPSLVISAVYDGPLPGGVPKGVEVYAINSIPDLSIYGIGFANNGGGTDGEEFTFPAVSVGSGTYIYVASEAFKFVEWYGFDPDYVDGDASINGDDAIELFMDGEVIDLFGDIDVDGSGEPWEYLDGWAYRVSETGPSATFNLADWTFSGPNALDGEATNATADTPVPVRTYSQEPSVGFTVTLTVTDEDLNEDECFATITVLDTLPPVVSCVGELTFVLDETGSVTIDPSDVDEGTEDGCGIDEMTLSMSTFTCENEGDNEVMLYATDIYGNIDSCMAVITIDGSEVISIVEGSLVSPTCFGFNDGSIDITVEGGTPDYAFDWDTDETGDFDDFEDQSTLGAGTYEVIVEDENGCKGTASFELEDPEEIIIETEVTNESCPGAGDGEIVIIVSGGEPPYTGADDLTGLNAGEYPITVTDANGCSATTGVTVETDLDIDLTITESGVDLTSNEDDPEATYQWLSCPDFEPIDGATEQTFTPEEEGSYAVMITISEVCVDTTECVEFAFESLEESNLLNALVYPNPTNGTIYVQVNEQLQSYQVTVMDLKGSILFEKQMTKNVTSFDLSGVSNGIYFVQLRSDAGVLTKKITVSK